MRKLKRVKIKDFSGVNGEISLELNDGVNVIAKPNGYGKTSIMNAIMFASTFLSHKAGEIAGKINPTFEIECETMDGFVYGRRQGKKKIEAVIAGVPTEVDEISKRLGVDEVDGYRTDPGSFLRDTKTSSAKKKNLMMTLLNFSEDELRAIFAPTGIADYSNPLETAKNSMNYRKNEYEKAAEVFKETQMKYKKIEEEFGGKESPDGRMAQLKKEIDELVSKNEDNKSVLSKTRIPFVTAKEKLEEVESELKKANAGLNKLENELTKFSTQAEGLKERYTENQKALKEVDEKGCPTCGSKSSTNSLKTKIERMTDDLIKEGKEMKVKISEIEKKVSATKEIIEEKEEEVAKIKRFLATEENATSDAKAKVDEIWKQLTEKRAELMGITQDDSVAIMQNLKGELEKEETKVKKAKEELDLANIVFDKVKMCLPELQDAINKKWKSVIFPKFEIKIYDVSEDGEYSERFEMLFEHNGVMKPYSDLSNAYKKMAELELSVNTGAKLVLMDEINSITPKKFDEMVELFKEKCPDTQFLLAWAKDEDEA